MDFLDGLTDLLYLFDLSTVIALCVCMMIGAAIYMGLIAAGVDPSTSIMTASVLTVVAFGLYMALVGLT